VERKDWLTILYREANLFLERQASQGDPPDPDALDDYEPELHAQLQEVLKHCDDLEDIVKFSLLRQPSPDLWYAESNWQHVLVAVAGACLVHDVKGIVARILSGELPQASSQSIHHDV
jgi:hypothetical protein